jgi:hypothetical protein
VITLCTILYLPHVNNATNAISLFHGVKSFVDICEGLSVSDKFINRQLAFHIIIHQARKLATALDATKGTSLEGSLLAYSGHVELRELTFQTRPVTSWNAAIG